MDSLSARATGLYLVQTASARYLLDLDARTVTRHPRTDPAGGRHLVADLRRDGDEVPLLAVVACQVGRSMVLLVQVADAPGVVTVRQTTPVHAIERLR